MAQRRLAGLERVLELIHGDRAFVGGLTLAAAGAHDLGHGAKTTAFARENEVGSAGEAWASNVGSQEGAVADMAISFEGPGTGARRSLLEGIAVGFDVGGELGVVWLAIGIRANLSCIGVMAGATAFVPLEVLALQRRQAALEWRLGILGRRGRLDGSLLGFGLHQRDAAALVQPSSSVPWNFSWRSTSVLE